MIYHLGAEGLAALRAVGLLEGSGGYKPARLGLRWVLAVRRDLGGRLRAWRGGKL